MAISPNTKIELAIEIRRIYAQAETEILEKLKRRIAKGLDNDNWQAERLQDITKYKKELNEIILKLEKEVPGKIENIINESYEAGIKSADIDLKQFDKELQDLNISEQVISLAKETTKVITNTHLTILRKSEDAYREIINSTIRESLGGATTRKQAAQKALNKFGNRGITSFIDKKGRQWDMASYTEMATRSSIGNASIQGHIDRMKASNRDLVYVTDHAEECELCRPWEGKILSISGTSTKYPSLSDAISQGLFHANCGHDINAYIEGLTDLPKNTSDKEGYENRSKQRYIERQIRHWKRREVVAIDEIEVMKAKNKISAWQKEQRNHLEDTDLRRKYERESITRAR